MQGSESRYAWAGGTSPSSSCPCLPAGLGWAGSASRAGEAPAAAALQRQRQPGWTAPARVGSTPANSDPRTAAMGSPTFPVERINRVAAVSCAIW